MRREKEKRFFWRLLTVKEKSVAVKRPWGLMSSVISKGKQTSEAQIESRQLRLIAKQWKEETQALGKHCHHCGNYTHNIHTELQANQCAKLAKIYL